MPPPPPPHPETSPTNPDAWSGQPSQPPSQSTQPEFANLQNPGWVTLLSGEQVELAGVGSRLAARVIDIVVCWGTVFLLGWVTYLTSSEGGESTDGSYVEASLAGAVAGQIFFGVMIAVVLYEPVSTAKWGRTLGKQIMNIRVVRFYQKIPPGTGQSFGRWGIQLAALITIIGLPLVYLSILWDVVRQGWHDRGAGTVVVKGRDFTE